MGNGIAHCFAQHGYSVQLIDVNAAQLDKAIQTITKNLDKQVAKGVISEEIKAKAIGLIKTSSSLETGMVSPASTSSAPTLPQN